MEYIIVQAGGKGSRLGYLTENKPKALVPVNNLPMIFHLFRKYPNKKYVIISDYKKDVMRNYLSAFAKVKYQVVDASGTGTCSGIAQAIELIPYQEAFMLIWSDLILPEHFVMPQGYQDGQAAKEDYVGLSQTFSCRWKYQDGVFAEEASQEYGVAGLFFFTDKGKLDNVPESGEFVRWLQQEGKAYKTVGLAGTKEFGVLKEYHQLAKLKCRPFNKISIDGEVLTKIPLDDQGKKLAEYEQAWYAQAMRLNSSVLPKIYSLSPLQMEYIHGKNIYDIQYHEKEKIHILEILIHALKHLHASEKVPADSFSLKEAYYSKTIKRLSAIENIIPFAREKKIKINGKWCRNIYYHQRELEKRLEKLQCCCFSFIHGDCTFSNLMVRDDGSPVLIDPRGYFGYTHLYGDERYDWAKLYYSIVGNYDQFNMGRFKLEIGGGYGADDSKLSFGEVALTIESNGWESMEQEFLTMTNAKAEEIKLLHAVIWLSLTTYAWQDYDSVCGAFYNGLYYLEDVL